MSTNQPETDSTTREQKLVRDLTPLVQNYINEVQSPASLQEFLKELSLVPIKWKGELMGFWGLKIGKNRIGTLAAIKAVYIVPKARGPLLNKFTDILMEGLAQRGVTHIEVWAFPEIERWLRRRYKFVTRIHVIQTPIEGFLTYDREALRKELGK